MAMSSRVIEQAIAARSAATVLRRLRRIDKDDLLAAMGIGLRKGVDEILAANGADAVSYTHLTLPTNREV